MATPTFPLNSRRSIDAQLNPNPCGAHRAAILARAPYLGGTSDPRVRKLQQIYLEECQKSIDESNIRGKVGMARRVGRAAMTPALSCSLMRKFFSTEDISFSAAITRCLWCFNASFSVVPAHFGVF